jgi:short-subunit dehydrogenase
MTIANAIAGRAVLSLKPLHEQVMVITGGSSGIGRVTAREAAKRGAALLLIARNEQSLREVADEIRQAGGTAAYVVADVGDIDQLRAAAAEATHRFGRIDTWVSNAGVAIYGKLVDIPLADHERLFRTNYFGAANSAQVAIPHLRAAGGAIIFIGSIASDLPSAILGAYAASKHAVKGFVDSLRMEITADALPISVTLIKPSGISTPIAERAASYVDGEPLVPAPVYDPQLAAEAILDAAVRTRREITVGGLGRIEMLLGTHFPNLLDRLARPLAGMMADPDRTVTDEDTLHAPVQPGRERSSLQRGRKVSLYGVADRHPVASVALLSLLSLGAFALVAKGRL